jgi:hypothetical protein
VIDELIYANSIQALSVDVWCAEEKGRHDGEEDRNLSVVFGVDRLVGSQTSPNLAIEVEEPGASLISV